MEPGSLRFSLGFRPSRLLPAALAGAANIIRRLDAISPNLDARHLFDPGEGAGAAGKSTCQSPSYHYHGEAALRDPWPFRGR